jgi:hypothetical protein
MDLQDLKRWHWMLIGLLAGGLWAWSQLSFGPQVEGKTFDGFEHDLLATKESPSIRGWDEGNVCIIDICVHPPVTDETPDAKTVPATRRTVTPKIQWVTGVVYHDRAIRDPNNWWLVKGHAISSTPFVFKAPAPYQPMDPWDDFVATKLPFSSKPFYRLPSTVKGYVKPATKSYPSITDYFDELNRKFGPGTVKYRYNWWESRWAVMTIYPLGGLLLIGGVWPTVLGLMVGAGFGSKRKQEEYGLSRYKGTSAPAAPKGPLVTDKDREQLAAMSAELEKNLQATATSAAPQAIAENAPAVAKLEAGTLEVTKKPQEAMPAKSFGADRGDYYPTEIHTKPKE